MHEDSLHRAVDRLITDSIHLLITMVCTRSRTAARISKDLIAVDNQTVLVDGRRNNFAPLAAPASNLKRKLTSSSSLPRFLDAANNKTLAKRRRRRTEEKIDEV